MEHEKGNPYRGGFFRRFNRLNTTLLEKINPYFPQAFSVLSVVNVELRSIFPALEAMMFKVLNTLWFRVVAMTVVLVASAVAGVTYYMQQEMGRVTRREQSEGVQNLLQSVMVSVGSQYENILFQKDLMLSARKDELRSVVGMAHNTLQGYYELAESGKLSEKEAQSLAIKELQRFRYEKGVGYIWVNDMARPVPRMIMHPTLPHLDGAVLDDPEFNCAQGVNKNLFVAFLDTLDSGDSGFVDYLWPKPTASGLSEKCSKLSFVQHFAPWGWVVGSGLYIDDIEEIVKRHIDAVIQNLNETYGEIKIGDSGYIFIFTGERETLYHPIYEGEELAEVINPISGNRILDDLMAAAHTTNGVIEYIWDKPGSKGEFRFEKTACLRHFEPLDWYIGATFYNHELDQPIRELRHKALFFSTSFLIVAIVLALCVTRGITRPLEQMVDVFAAGTDDDYSVRFPVNRCYELACLANYFNRFMAEIEMSHQQFSASENRFKTSFDRSLDARLIIENDRFTECNAAAVKLLHGSSKSDIVGKCPSEISPCFQPDGQRSDEKADELLCSVEKTGYDRFLWQHMRLDGEEFPVEVELSPIPYEGRIVVHVLLRDLSQQKKMEQELVQAQKMETVGNLAGGLAHDFNNILSGIVGTVSLAKLELEQGILTDELLLEYLGMMELSGRRAAAMVQQLLALSRKQETSFELIDLNSVIEHVRIIAKNSFDRSIQFNVQPWPSVAQTLADPGQIEQVLLNCCVNAAHSMTTMCRVPEDWGGTLGISINRITDFDSIQQLHANAEAIPYWCLSICDSGVGMDKETQGKVFTPFFTTKGKDEGSGLGLSMVYNIVQQHKGFVDIESALGKGTCVKIFLPEKKGAIASEAGDVSKKQVVPPSGDGLILIVDDEALMRDMGSRILRKFGYEVLTAEDGMTGVSCFREHMKEIALVLLDMAMPGMSGRETYLELRKIDPSVKVVLVSGYSQDDRVREVLNLGVCGFIQKPYLLNTLMTEVNRVVEG